MEQITCKFSRKGKRHIVMRDTYMDGDEALILTHCHASPWEDKEVVLKERFPVTHDETEFCAVCLAYFEFDDERDDRFRKLNDRIWGEGNWIRCSTCPHDASDREVYHHVNAHAGPALT